MNPPACAIEVRGRVIHQPLPDTTGDTTLAVWLAELGYPLNTRCGGRGVCQGCRVVIQGTSHKACQTAVRKLVSDAHIEIPNRSLHDEQLDGISVFELGTNAVTRRSRPGVGVAIDIGTTTIAAALWDLASGRCLAEGTCANAQRRHGDNVLARIDYAQRSPEARLQLQAAVARESITPLLARLCARANLELCELTEGVVAGNTVMLHTLVGASLTGLATFPFRPLFLDCQQIIGSSVGFLHAFPLTTAPCLGAFVGADIAVGALATGMLEREQPALLIDFGTNGEILLKTREGYLAAATAAGPAFEGGRLQYGAAAGPGVASGFEFENRQWRVLGAHGTETPTGISGAAYVDLLALGLAHGIITPMGRLVQTHPAVETFEDEGDPAWRVPLPGGLALTEADIAELMQAKAAILGGVSALLETADLLPRDLGTVYIAGGFGYHLNPDHACAVGLIPNLPADRLRIVGNASLGGASLLLQAGTMEPLAELRKRCRTIELNQLESFEDHFVDALSLAPAQTFE